MLVSAPEQIEFHPVAEIFPLMTGAALGILAALAFGWAKYGAMRNDG